MTLALRIFPQQFQYPSRFAEFSLASDGWWNNIAEPRAAYYNGQTYFAWVNETGDIYAASYNHSTKTTTTPFYIGSALSSPSGNVHNSVAILVRSSDKKLVIAYCEEGDSVIRLRISTNAEDATAWGSQFTIMSGGSYTYVSLFQMGSGTMFLVTRSIVSSVAYLAITSSIDGGATWDSSATNLIAPTTGTGNPSAANYWRVGSDGTNLHFLVTDTDRSDAHPSSVYHIYFTPGSNVYKSDGTSLGNSFPIAATNGTLVQNTSLGPAWAEGVGFVGGNPAGVLLAYDSGNTRNRILACRWSGSSWDVTEVDNTGGILTGNRFVAGAAIDRADPDTIWAMKEIAGTFELVRYVSGDSGATWTAQQVTISSPADNAALDTPFNAAAGMAAIFGQGTFVDATDFDFSVMGASTA